MEERLLVDGALLARVGQQRLDLRGERDAVIVDGVVERLDADAVADQPERLLASVPDGDGEHAPEAMQAVDAPLLEGVEDDLRIGVVRGPGVTPERFELRADLGVVVDLAVEDDAQAAVLVGHGLVRRVAQVDDGEPSEPEADARILVHPEPWAIRTPVDHRLAHVRDQARLHPIVGAQRHDAGDAAHQVLPVMRSWTRSAISVACTCCHSGMGQSPPRRMAPTSASSSWRWPFSLAFVLTSASDLPARLSRL